MKKQSNKGLDFVIDKITNSIENMKNNDKELDVDFIGGQKPMTKEEELAISEFIRVAKEKKRRLSLQKTKLNTPRKNKQPA